MIGSYLKLAVKVLLRRKFFTFVSLFGTSFTLVVLMVVAAMIDQVLSPEAPEVNLDRTLFISRMAMRGADNEWTGGPGYLFLDRYCRDLPGVERMSLYTESGQSIGFVDGNKVMSNVRRTDAEYWNILRFRFVEGSPYTADDVERGAMVAVINEASRQRFFGGRPALGRTLETGGRSYRVVGVVKNVSNVRVSAFGDLWAPLTTASTDDYKGRLMGNFNAALLARSPAAFPGIRAEFQRRLPGVQMTDPKHYDRMQGSPRTRLEEIAGEIAGTEGPEERARTGLLVLALGVAGLLFMSLPAMNLVNLNVSRILERAPEIGIRKAFGATSNNLVGQFLVENFVLVLAGGLIGLVAAAGALELINRSGVIAHADFRLNIRIFLDGLLLCTLFTVLSGAWPAWRMSRLNPVEALKGGSR